MFDTVAHYRILGELGKGGMGVVYLAEDTRLRRKVALKVLPAEQAADPGWLARFEREAQAVAALNHPNIVTLHSIEQSDGIQFLTMEWVEGEMLAQVIPSGGLAWDRLKDLALEIADAVAAAHDKGVTHRDLKPANIMVNSAGRVKVLDFGLAKFESEAPSTADAPTEFMSQAGTLIGTVRYMSPEQVRGQPVDARSDVFALGTVFYEMATGEHPFPGATPTETMAAILRDSPPDLTVIRASAPADLVATIGRCLAKDQDERFQSAGEVRDALRGLQDLTLLADAAGPAVESRPGLAVPPNTIAVLPFADLSPDGDQEYFCDGVAEELIHALAKIRGLHVAARSSSFRFKGKGEDPKRIGELLGVRSLLEGSVRKAGSRLRIAVELSDVDDGYQTWSERFDREMEDVFAIQDDIARRVVESLELELSGVTRMPQGLPPAHDLGAYQLYLQGRYEWNKRTPDSLDLSLGLFQQAIDRDPTLAGAFAGLADAYVLLGIYGARAPDTVMPLATKAAMRAVEIDSTLSSPHASLACVQSVYERAWRQSEQNFQLAIRLEPSNATAHQWYAMNLLLPLGRFDEALERLVEAKTLDPLSPAVASSHAWCLYYARRFEQAAQGMRAVLELDSRFAMARFFLGMTLAEMGRSGEAIVELEAAIGAMGDSAEVRAGLGYVYARAGRLEESKAELRRLEARSETGYVSPSLLAQVHVGQGNSERALTLLKEARDGRSTDLAWAGQRPVFDPIRSEPRFGALLVELGLGVPGS